MSLALINRQWQDKLLNLIVAYAIDFVEIASG